MTWQEKHNRKQIKKYGPAYKFFFVTDFVARRAHELGVGMDGWIIMDDRFMSLTLPRIYPHTSPQWGGSDGILSK